MQIRRFRPSDADALSALILQNLQEVNSQHYTPQQLAPVAAGYTAEALRRPDAGDMHIYVAVAEDGALLGCGAVCPHSRLPGAAYIGMMFVRVDAHGQGVGRAIMHSLEEDPLALAATGLHLNATLTAEGFYKRLGYNYPGGQRQVLPEAQVIPLMKRKPL